ncbi:hypothetical protein BRC81_09890 [Halobacteriales archaeon QS_1_68_20]|nr:MAG: hypothetical protein BRC81_09890 [Halobacteriales archaeon QS_1_68_20]
MKTERSGNGNTGSATCDGRTNETAAVSGDNTASFYFQGGVCFINYSFNWRTPLSETITLSFG